MICAGNIVSNYAVWATIVKMRRVGKLKVLNQGVYEERQHESKHTARYEYIMLVTRRAADVKHNIVAHSREPPCLHLQPNTILLEFMSPVTMSLVFLLSKLCCHGSSKMFICIVDLYVCQQYKIFDTLPWKRNNALSLVSGNTYTSPAILTAWQNFTRRELFYGEFMSPATIKTTSRVSDFNQI